jgi:hypothetical protein
VDSDSPADSGCTPSNRYPDQDGYGAGEPSSACEAPDAWVERDGDFDDTDGPVLPGAETVHYDDVDQDCDGSDLPFVLPKLANGAGLDFLQDINADGCDALLIGKPGYEHNRPADHGPGSVNLIFGVPGMP